jgi:glutaredoxin
MITIYTIQDCPNCENIKSKLTAAGYEFREEDMCSPENITELRSNGCFAMEAPVLRVDDTFYEYCACSQSGFFSELFGVRPDQQEVPQHDGRMEMPFQDED